MHQETFVAAGGAHAPVDALDDSGLSTTRRRRIALWLFCCCALVLAMVVLGGVTRLTGSGLSMVDWRPITGVVPPLSDAEWSAEFQRYQQSPEYLKKNLGMSLGAFKRIFLFEYAHRLLGRVLGVVFLLGFLFFLVRRWLDRPLAIKLGVAFLLGGLQGLLGWYMVKSGLVDQPHVSQYRLTAHLAAAVLIYGYMLWLALSLWFRREGAWGTARGLRTATTAIATLVVLTIVSGALVAGLKAGLIFNTFPRMGERWIPEGLLALRPWPVNFAENLVTVQFDHRVLAAVTFFGVLALWARALRQALPRRLRLGYHLLAAIAVAQVGLGISTLLLQVPTTLAATHQGMALVLFSVALYLVHGLRNGPDPTAARATR